jgi:hypothetical protein
LKFRAGGTRGGKTEKTNEAFKTKRMLAAMMLSVMVILAGCSAPNSPGFLDGLGGRKRSVEAIREFEAFLADVKTGTPEFVKRACRIRKFISRKHTSACAPV